MLFLFFFFFQGIPGHLLLPILENLDPLEIEKLEVSSIFKATSMLEKIFANNNYEYCTVN